MIIKSSTFLKNEYNSISDMCKKQSIKEMLLEAEQSIKNSKTYTKDEALNIIDNFILNEIPE